MLFKKENKNQQVRKTWNHFSARRTTRRLRLNSFLQKFSRSRKSATAAVAADAYWRYNVTDSWAPKAYCRRRAAGSGRRTSQVAAVSLPSLPVPPPLNDPFARSATQEPVVHPWAESDHPPPRVSSTRTPGRS